MEIKYLKKLEENLSIYHSPCEPLSLNEIQSLEMTYNDGNPFPEVLKELLFMAGEYCMVLDFGYGGENDEESAQSYLQSYVREVLAANNNTINRPFYVVELWQGYTFSFVFLDEGNDPNLYNGLFSLSGGHPEFEGKFYQNSGIKISDLINIRINLIKEGLNPF